ncbi:putative disease resistance RPP13-like protein 1 [Citrus sinensis]|uniref:Disease resistance RPP13-like protein 1 n=1 Tax=Citrus sinensis TaxID=2711 RepID=A0ACB8I412_CITSI|nr:putative disease resistance RPP13-like protein 1 [Citrus sinensis]
MATSKFQVEKFTGENEFHLWRLKMRALLVHQGLEETLGDPRSEKKPSKLSNEERSKIKAISSRLEELCKRRTVLGLEKIAGGSTHSATVRRRPPTTCLTSEPAVYGRNEDKARILDMVLKNDPSDAANFRVIPLVGMGGIGKTTLAQEVYNDKLTDDFKPKAWVCVSDDFDILRISKAILESITRSSCGLTDLNSVQLKLKEAVFKKNRIIVTTRSMDVALKMGSGKNYELKHLSDDDCWSVFLNHAFEGIDTGTQGNFESTRQRVVAKCKGLPLAARALGGLLRSKQRVDEWRAILNSKIWDLEDEIEIPSVLKLSYHHLPSHLKRCFAYCAILPKDYEFQEEELVLLWIAEGFIQQSKYSKQLEDWGSEYFHDLLSRSMFQKSSNNESKFVMHDLVHDLAQWASGDTCFRLDYEFSEDRQSKVFEKVRHCSYIRSRRFAVKDKFKFLDEVENLRTFLPIFMEDFFISFCISPMVLSDLLPKCKKLRVLSLEKDNIAELPSSIGNLVNLHHLDIEGLKNVIDSQEANEAMLRGKKDLEVLKLVWSGGPVDELREKNILDMLKPHCNIKRLEIISYGSTRFPSWVGDPSFSNVAVLKLENCDRCTSLPSLGQLCSLKDLTIVGMSALKSVGSEIYGEGCSKPFRSLQTLYFEDLQEWEHWEPNRENDEHVQAFSHLRKLSIKRCPKLSGRLPNHLPSLEEIVIAGCMHLAVSLPSLPALCTMEIDGCKRLVCDGPSESKSLNEMALCNISKFENWSSQKLLKK